MMEPCSGILKLNLAMEPGDGVLWEQQKGYQKLLHREG